MKPVVAHVAERLPEMYPESFERRTLLRIVALAPFENVVVKQEPPIHRASARLLSQIPGETGEVQVAGGGAEHLIAGHEGDATE
jgi:hypothetical protein